MSWFATVYCMLFMCTSQYCSAISFIIAAPHTTFTVYNPPPHSHSTTHRQAATQLTQPQHRQKAQQVQTLQRGGRQQVLGIYPKVGKFSYSFRRRVIMPTTDGNPERWSSSRLKIMQTIRRAGSAKVLPKERVDCPCPPQNYVYGRDII